MKSLALLTDLNNLEEKNKLIDYCKYENLEVDISSLNLGESLRAGDINLEEKFSLSTDEMQTIASVTQAMKEEVKAEEDEEGADSDTEAASDDSSDSSETSTSEEKAEGESEG